MGKKNWGARILELLRKGRDSNTPKHNSHTGTTVPPFMGSTSRACEASYQKMVDEAVNRYQASLHQQHRIQQQQVLLATRPVQLFRSTSQCMSTVTPIQGLAGGPWSSGKAIFGQQGSNPMDADSNKRDSEERHTGRYIVIECQITPTDEEPLI